MGNAPAAGTVFRALAENFGRAEKFPAPDSGWMPKVLDVKARPPTPRAGVLPNLEVRV